MMKIVKLEGKKTATNQEGEARTEGEQKEGPMEMDVLKEGGEEA